MEPLAPHSTIGMLGGGQLGRMATLVAKRLGYNVVTLEPAPNSPCGQVADNQLVAAYDDPAALDELARRCDVVTYEFENVPSASVERLTAAGVPVYPGARLLDVAQNRLREKRFARQLGLKVADFQAVTSRTELEQAIERIGFPAILKTTHGGYDGKGQFVLNTAAEANRAFETLQGRELIWEQRVEFVKELSVICARNRLGKVVIYPAAETIHVNHVLDTSLAPARVAGPVQAEAQRIAHVLAEAFELVGVCGIEMFLLPDDTILINEIAPRPHNSGHHTIESCVCSQFEQQVRAVCGLPLGSVELTSPAVMVNLLGTGRGNQLAGLADLLAIPNLHLHLYGKAEAKAGRKMGHLTVRRDDVEEALEVALEARQMLSWQ
ncbi:MAG TPA: 5-(carboxyamino)imidazole ribonucleotide synthase [Anaerolineae bacterium]|nr:5-(carboxyamino)imidazole ribonucleotide synthase [Anaerolineae bacterium]